MAQYYYTLDGTTQLGPVDAAGLKAAGAGPATMVWAEGMGDWQPAGQVAALSGLFAGQTNFPPPPPVSSGPMFQHPPVGYQAPPAPSSGTNGFAVASLICSICGLVGFCCCGGIVASILGIVFGHIARGQIKRGQGSGDGVALAGLVLGYVGIALAILGLSIGISNHGFRSSGPNFNWNLGPK